MRFSRRERKTLFGAVNLINGKLTGQIADTGNAVTFQGFLDAIRLQYRRGTTVIILDNVRFHHARVINAYLKRYQRLHFLFLPPYHPKLNPQEMVWQTLRRNVTHNTYYPTFAKEVAATKLFFKKFIVEIKNAPASLIVRN